MTASQARAFWRFSGGTVAPIPVAFGEAPASGAGSPRWKIGPALPFLRPAAGTFAPLDLALRQVNFQPSSLLPGTLDAFAGTDDSHYAVPGYIGAWGVQYNTSVYTRLGLREPAPDWTIDDFEQDCAVIAAGIVQKKLDGVAWVMPPLVATGGTPTLNANGYYQPPSDQFREPDLWGAFVRGFGGTVVTAGRFDLTNPGAVAGLQRMVDIATRYGARGGAPIGPAKQRVNGVSTSQPTTEAQSGVRTQMCTETVTHDCVVPVGPYALMFAPTAQPLLTRRTELVEGWRWARFPILPAGGPVPLQVGGFTVLAEDEGWSLVGGAPPGAPEQALAAQAEYALWFYKQDRTTPGLAGLPAPALADTTVQHAYWQAPRGPAGYPAVGDWAHFAVVEEGWPLVPGSSSISPSPVFDALAQAVTQRIPVANLLAQVTQKLNAMLSNRREPGPTVSSTVA